MLPVVPIAILAGVVVAAGGAGAASNSTAAHGKILGIAQLQGKTHGGIVDVSRFLGPKSRVPVEVAPNKFRPLRSIVLRQKALNKKALKLRRAKAKSLRGRLQKFNAPAVGDTRAWLALDDGVGFYFKKFELRKLSNNTEIWVAKDVARVVAGTPASGTNFRPGDCRNGTRTQITNAQVDYLAAQFDTNILPKESVEFSVAPDRNGASHGALPPAYNPSAASVAAGDHTGPAPIDPEGAGNRTVVLVDNVRDDNFHDLNNTQGNSYIAGFFSGGLNALFDRNIMTIDAFDWLHRTGATPPHNPVAGNNCTSAPARPFLYEGVFAHEYQHLLQSYQDPSEVNFINEGLSDFAIDVTGYDFSQRPVSQIGFDSHLQCFMGNLVFQTDANPNPRGGGPENSLTLWGDQGDGEILCDYGAAFSFMEYLSSQYGSAFMTQLHRDPLPGLTGLQHVLGGRATSADVIHRWAAAMALDGVLDRGAMLQGAKKDASLYQIGALDAGINWDNPDAYSTPGAPPNGSDYIRLRDGGNHYFSANTLKSLSFTGAKTLEPQPVEWTVTNAAPDHEGDSALAAPDADNKDAAIVRSVAVPAGSPTLTFDTLYSTEPGYDSFFVQVSTDGGATYQSLANADTTCDLAADASAALTSNCPGLNGESGGWVSESYDLSPYAGQTVLLALRYITDVNTRGDGVWVDNVKIGSTVVSDGSSLAGWQTFTQIKPVAVNGYTVQVIAYSTDGKKAFIGSIPLNSNFSGSLNADGIEKLMTTAPKVDVVAALVMYDEPTQSINQYARYTLKANGVTQPGG
jgi:Immune inhibitor A peptidase M6